MRLLFDVNLSPRLVGRLADLYPGSAHVAAVGLGTATDLSIWTYARANGFAIVTKDADFGDIGLARGFPPKVIWLRLGNCSTHDIEWILRQCHTIVLTFGADPDVGILTLI